MNFDEMFGIFQDKSQKNPTNLDNQKEYLKELNKKNATDDKQRINSIQSKNNQQIEFQDQNRLEKKRSGPPGNENNTKQKDEYKQEKRQKLSNDSTSNIQNIINEVEHPQISDDEDIDKKILENIEKMVSVKNVENSTLKMGYNEEDYQIKITQTPNCIHEFISPKGYIRPEFVKPKIMAKEYPFKLDTFQEKAVECIMRNESILVAAHTSAGKTAVAEYAIAQSLKNNQRVIYTSPIKALSNQKYRELQEEFGDVGLMTGDVTMNESSSCIVMTTEILRSMLYNGSEIVRETAWVIFDEVHYMRDKERGVVWEETIILLPKQVKYCFLSATIPNSREFAEWIVKIKQQPCSVVYTDYRPTPLQHYIFPTGANGIHLVVDENGNFKDQNFAKAIATLEQDLDLSKILEEKNNKKKQQKLTMQQEMKKLITLIVNKALDPCIVFSFSKRECEQYLMSLKTCDFNNEDEKAQIDQIYKNAMQTLSDDDQQIPMITMLPNILRRGIGIHHGGLIPIVKEVIELLFQEGLIKILFTTETFAMGINMPAKTVVFTSMEKFDGEEFRYVTGGEYIQMSGRAGRRGLDDRGITILMANKKLEPENAKAILKGQSDPLYSSFHLGYNMLLNMMRIEDIHPEDIIMHSFHQFQQERACPKLKQDLIVKIAEYKSLKLQNEKQLLKKQSLLEKQKEIKDEIRKIIIKPENIVPFLVPGRIINIKTGKDDWGWGVLSSFSKQKITAKNKKDINPKIKKGDPLTDISQSPESTYVLDIYLYIKDMLTTDTLLQPGDIKKGDGRLGLIPVVLHESTVSAISTIQLNLPNNHKDQETSKTIELMFEQLMKRFDYGNQFKELHPIEDMEIEFNENVDEINIKDLVDAQERIEEELLKPELNDISKEDLQNLNQKQQIKKEISEMEQTIKKASQMIMSEDLVHMKRVMRRLELINKHDVPNLKGKAAASISAADEIITTELLFSGFFQDLDPIQIASVLTCLVYTDNKSEEKPIKDEKLTKPFASFIQICEKIADVMIDSKIEMNKIDFVKKFSPDMMEIAQKWCQGAKFREICELSDSIFEGTIIRCFRRLDELISQLVEASKIIGNNDLKDKFIESQKNLKRGIIFTASLYL